MITRYLVPRLGQLGVLLLLMSVAVFGLMHLMPGDPVDLLVAANPNASADDVARLRAAYGLDLPWWQRYGNWLGGVVQGDWGYSRLYQQPVMEILPQRLAASLSLLLPALIIAWALAVPLGVYGAARPGGASDRIGNFIALLGAAIPSFWLGLLLILLFAVYLGWLPAGGAPPVGSDAVVALRYYILPVACLVLLHLALVLRHSRMAMSQELGEPYIRTALAKGLGHRQVLWRHGFPNASIPLLTILGMELGGLAAGAVMLETIFAWPGMGKLLYDAVMGNDYNLALAALLLLTSMVMLGNFLADMLVLWRDPRARTGAW